MKSNENKLTMQQEMFCKLFTTVGDTFGNATKSYSGAYGIELPLNDIGVVDIASGEYKQCNANGSRNMSDDSIVDKIRVNYVALLNDTNVDARLSHILYSGSEQNSLQAVKVYNDLKQRITKKIDITTAGNALSHMSDKELEDMI